MYISIKEHIILYPNIASYDYITKRVDHVFHDFISVADKDIQFFSMSFTAVLSGIRFRQFEEYITKNRVKKKPIFRDIDPVNFVSILFV